MAILISIWMIAGYFGKTACRAAVGTGAAAVGRTPWSVGDDSVDAGGSDLDVRGQRVVILMMAPVALPWRARSDCRSRRWYDDRLLGKLHGLRPAAGGPSAADAAQHLRSEFMEFIWSQGRPSSFPILMATFIVTLAAMYAYGFRTHSRRAVDIGASASRRIFRTPVRLRGGRVVPADVLAMASGDAGRELGFIALTGAITLVLALEAVGERVKAPALEKILGELDWRAIFSTSRCSRWSAGLEKMNLIRRACAPDTAGIL